MMGTGHFLLSMLIVSVGSFVATAAADNTGFRALSSSPQSLYVFGEHVYCSAEDGVHGRELWRVSVPEGTPELVCDITPGERGSQIDRFHTFQEKLYFRVKDPTHGGELWWSDGAPGGITERLMRFKENNSRDGVESILGDVGGRLFFSAGSPDGNRDIYIIDGAQEGIRRFFPEQMTNFTTKSIDGLRWGEYLFLPAYASRGSYHRNGLWRTDGTEAGTVFLAAFPNPPGGFLAMGTKGVLFGGITDDHGMEPWFTKGTPESTHMLRDIWPEGESSDPGDPAYLEVPSHPERSRAFFRATHPDYGEELWETDGTPEGTKLFKDLVPGPGSSSPQVLTAFPNRIYLRCKTDALGEELWALSPGDMWQLYNVLDINPGYKSSSPYSFVQSGYNEALVFSAEDERGEELWVSQGSGHSTRMLMDIQEGEGSSEPHGSVKIGQLIAFTAYDPIHGSELWFTDGDANTRLLCDIYSDDSENPSSSPEELTPLGDLMLFTADDIEHGIEPWVTNGEASGTLLLMDIYPGSIGSQPTELTVVGDVVYFAAEAPGTGVELYVSDGTPAGTGLLRDIAPGQASSAPKYLTAWKGYLFFSASRTIEGEEPWIVRPGRKADILRNIRADGLSSNPRDFTPWKDHVYFLANDGIHGEELWRTDGTKDGTVMVKDIVAVPFEKLSYHSLRTQGEHLFITATLPRYGQELWRFEDDRTAPRLVMDIASRARFR